MKYLAPILVVFSFACFFDPQGQGIWVMPSQVVSVQHNPGDCAPSAKTKIVTQSGTLCVRETPQEVTKRLDAIRDDTKDDK